jgi:hypothetical protein
LVARKTTKKKQLNFLTQLLFMGAMVLMAGEAMWGLNFYNQYQAAQATKIEPVDNGTPVLPTVALGYKIYRNQELGFEMQIPQEWKEPSVTVLQSRTDINFNNGLAIGVGKFLDQGSNKELNYLEAVKNGQGEAEPEMRLIDGRPAAIIKTRLENAVAIEDGERVVMVYQSFYPKEVAAAGKVFERVVATFGFENEAN